jgi:hypothetical protein
MLTTHNHSKGFKNGWNYTSAPPYTFMTCTMATLLTCTLYFEDYTNPTSAICGQSGESLKVKAGPN